MAPTAGRRPDVGHLAAKGGKGLLDAIANGDVSKAQGLVLAGADVNGVKTASGMSVLHMAASQSCTGLCRLLISHNADVNAPDGQLWTVLHMAAQQGQSLLLLQLLEARAAVDVLNIDGESPMCLSAGSGHLEVMKHLIRASASPDAVVVEGLEETDFLPVAPLLRAVERNVSYNVIVELIAMRARVDCTDRKQGQPLHHASQNGSVQIIRMLLDGHADPNARNSSMRTPLHYASSSGAGRVIKTLVQHHADVDALDGSNMTPIQIAKDRLTEMQLRELGARSGYASPSNRPATPGEQLLGAPRGAPLLARSAVASLSPLARCQSSPQLQGGHSPPKGRHRRPGPGVAALIVGAGPPTAGAGSPKVSPKRPFKGARDWTLTTSLRSTM